MSIPVSKLISISGNRYEYNVAANRLVEKSGNTVIEGITLDSWKIVPKILQLMLDEKLHYYKQDPQIENFDSEGDESANVDESTEAQSGEETDGEQNEVPNVEGTSTEISPDLMEESASQTDNASAGEIS